MSLFAKAAEKTKVKKAVKAPKKETIWPVGDPESVPAAKSVHALVELNAQKKAIDGKMAVHKTVLLTLAKTNFFTQYADAGVAPDTPMKLRNSDGESITFVNQERNQYGVKPESETALAKILGEDGAAELVYEETLFGFDRSVLAKEGVMDVLGKHLEAAMAELTDSVAGGPDAVLTGDEADALLSAEVKKSYRPGVLQRLGVICGKDSTKMRQVCEAIGSGCVQYVKV